MREKPYGRSCVPTGVNHHEAPLGHGLACTNEATPYGENPEATRPESASLRAMDTLALVVDTLALVTDTLALVTDTLVHHTRTQLPGPADLTS